MYTYIKKKKAEYKHIIVSTHWTKIKTEDIGKHQKLDLSIKYFNETMNIETQNIRPTFSIICNTGGL